MDWIYGDEVCIAPHIPVADWIYGDEVCVTLPSLVYPTDSRVRVTSLIHRWEPGLYLLEIGLGDLTSEFAIPDIIRQPSLSGLEPTPTPEPSPSPQPSPNECTHQGKIYSQGRYVCMGQDKYVCFEGRWIIAKKDAPECGKGGCTYVGVDYPEGSVITVAPGRALRCVNGKWQVVL